MSLRDLPSLYDIRGGSLNISLSNGCSPIKCQCFMSICFTFGWVILCNKRQDFLVCWYLTLSRKLSKATDCCTGGSRQKKY